MIISVVIPMYNAEETIIETLNSVKTQNVLPFEIIVINDGSTDDSNNIVSDYISKNSLLNITLINKINGGVSTARNAGIKAARGNWIALLDSDDKWFPNKLERQIEVLQQNPQIDFLGASRNGEYFGNILWKKINVLTKISYKMLLVKFVFIVPTIIFKKSITETVGFFDENQRYAEEGIYFIRIAKKFNCYLLNESLAFTGGGKNHFGDSGLSGNLKEMEKGELKNLKDLLGDKSINYLQYLGLVIFSILKYIRRIIVVKLRKI